MKRASQTGDASCARKRKPRRTFSDERLAVRLRLLCAEMFQVPCPKGASN